MTPIDKLRKVQEALDGLLTLGEIDGSHGQATLSNARDALKLIPSLMKDLETVEVELQLENIPFVARCIKCNPPKEK